MESKLTKLQNKFEEELTTELSEFFVDINDSNVSHININELLSYSSIEYILTSTEYTTMHHLFLYKLDDKCILLWAYHQWTPYGGASWYDAIELSLYKHGSLIHEMVGVEKNISVLLSRLDKHPAQAFQEMEELILADKAMYW